MATLAFLLVIIFTSASHAQRNFGVRWDVPASEQQARDELNQFLSHGIERVEVSERVSPSLLRAMARDSIRLYVSLPFEFLLPSDPVRLDSAYRETLTSFINHYRPYPHIEGIGLFRYGAVYAPAFRKAASRYAETLKKQFGYSIYYTTAQNGDIPAIEAVDWTRYHYQGDAEPSWEHYGSVIFDGALLESPYHVLGNIIYKTEAYDSYPIFFQGQWLLSSIESNRKFSNYLKSASRDALVIYPFDKSDTTTSASSQNYLVLCLILLWAIFAVHYSIHPVFRRNLFRYFFSHTFFCRDILEWRIRIPDTGYILFFQHVLVGAVWIYALARRFFTPLGAEAIQHHISFLSKASLWPITFLVGGFLFVLIFQTISVIWLYTFNKSAKHIGQILLLYSWPLQINLGGLTLLIPLIITGAADIYIWTLTLVFAAIWFSSFCIAAFDLSTSAGPRSNRYQLLTVLPYTVSLAFVMLYTLLYTKMPELIQLVVRMSY